MHLLLATATVDVNHVSHTGISALHEAAFRMDRETTTILLDAGATLWTDIWHGTFRPPWNPDLDARDKARYVELIRTWRVRKIL